MGTHSNLVAWIAKQETILILRSDKKGKEVVLVLEDFRHTITWITLVEGHGDEELFLQVNKKVLGITPCKLND